MGCTCTCILYAYCFLLFDSGILQYSTAPYYDIMCSVSAPNTQYNEDSSSTLTTSTLPVDAGSSINTLYLRTIRGTIVQYRYLW
jgi:hypothetical protein